MSLLFRNRSVEKGASSRGRLPWWRRAIMVPVHHIQQAVASLGELWRNPFASLMTMAVLGLSLTLPSSLYVLVKNTSSITDSWQQASEITLFLKKDLQTSEIETFKTQTGLSDKVESVRWVPKDEGLQQFKEQSGFGETLDYLTKNPLPDVLVVIPAENYRTVEQAEALLLEFQNKREVAHAKLDIEWLNRLQAILDLIEDTLGALALVLCLSVVLIVGNTIRLNILSKRDEIVIMKLVGATNAFIQRPFLYTGAWYGFIGGIFAWLVTILLIWWIESAVLNVTNLYDSQFQLDGLTFGELIAIWVIAIGLGLAGSYLAVRRHIQSIEPE
ncbi:cell division protein FtsX [Idiomarina sp. X4]|uniref:permease-like cell division protein FtsX n=1 Tax=Idiomarina sp. X4 TaxID=2055892 RepID=UPI000C28C738|nr:permease-like cell division protein FtsX [Idiomarina sp. X4]ATZ72997.1 cell division protein FtsX [Idiomarina sp. X4]